MGFSAFWIRGLLLRDHEKEYLRRATLQVRRRKIRNRFELTVNEVSNEDSWAAYERELILAKKTDFNQDNPPSLPKWSWWSDLASLQ